MQWPDTTCCHAASALLADTSNCHVAIAPNSQKPFNGETPHALLSSAFVTPADIHFVRNHMPVPHGLSAAEHRWGLGGPRADAWETPALCEGLRWLGTPAGRPPGSRFLASISQLDRLPLRPPALPGAASQAVSSLCFVSVS